MPSSSKPASQADLKALEKRLDALAMIIVDRYSTLEKQLQASEKEVIHQFGVISEQLMRNFLGATSDTQDIHRNKLNDHDTRLSKIEEALGIQAL